MTKQAKTAKTVRNEQEAQIAAKADKTPLVSKPDDLHALIIDMTNDAVHAQGLADRMLAQAKGYCDEAGVLDTVRFTSDCANQEAWIVSDQAGKLKTNRVPRNWVNVKSNILRAVKPAAENGTGKSLTEFGTMHELRKALPRKPRQPKPETAITKVNTASLDPSTIARFEALAGVASMLNPEGVDGLNEAMDDLITEFKAHAKAHPKAKEVVTGTSKQEPLMPEDEIEDVDLSVEEKAELSHLAKHH